MRSTIAGISILYCIVCLNACKIKTIEQQPLDSIKTELHRPHFHFTPHGHWMNDPNGLIYYNGTYHLFYQHYPDSTVWGPMHWGHATSKDLLHWQHHPIALYPDTLGLIFSGSAVLDRNNTSGFGTIDNPPLIAMFTYHSVEKEKVNKMNFQYQGIAYSLDSGMTWRKYDTNPVLKIPTSTDFRDPKVFWHDESKKWVVILAVKDHTELYGSPDMKTWTRLSEFGKSIGAHGGVWECPDLFEMTTDKGEKKWVMLVSINPGGPNGGSATQYFTGQFDGVKFMPDQDATENKWIDVGPDNYAGVTWSNAPDGRRLFLGWMSNWAYAQQVPTATWRSAMTIPRELKLVKLGERYFVKSAVPIEINNLPFKEKAIDVKSVFDSLIVADDAVYHLSTSMLTGSVTATNFEFVLSNDSAQCFIVGFDSLTNRFYTDRRRSGKNHFSKDFFPVSYASRILTLSDIKFTIVNDVASSEILFDDGLTVMTSIYFPAEKMNKLTIVSKSKPLHFSSLTVKQIR